MLNDDTLIKATDNQVSSELGDEKVILELSNGVYYGLSGVGGRVWELIQQPVPLKELRKKLLDEYEVDENQCTQDLHALLDDLSDHNLIEIQKEE